MGLELHGDDVLDFKFNEAFTVYLGWGKSKIAYVHSDFGLVNYYISRWIDVAFLHWRIQFRFGTQKKILYLKFFFYVIHIFVHIAVGVVIWSLNAIFDEWDFIGVKNLFDTVGMNVSFEHGAKYTSWVDRLVIAIFCFKIH